MATTQAFLKETVLQNKFIRPGVVKVVMHVEGPLEDGSVVKEVADNTIYMKAIFTPQALNNFHTSFEDSFNSPPDWNQALLLLNQFHVEFQSASVPNNTERRPRFVLVVERFGLYNLHEGFYSKNQPQNIMADPEVQAKAEEMEKDFMERQSENVQSQDCSDVPMSVLLEQMGQSSIADMTFITSQCEEEGTDVTEATWGGLNVVHTLQSALEKMHCMDCEEFIVRPEEQAILDAIPEWKDDYIPPASESSEEQQSKASMAISFHVLLETSTLHHDVCQVLDHPSSPTTKSGANQRVKRSDADHRQAGETPIGDGPSPSAQNDTNPRTGCGTHGGSQAVTMEDSAVVQEDNTEAGKGSEEGGYPSTVAASASRANQQAPDSSDASKSSVDSSTYHHPDVAFTISSVSNLGDNSSSLEEIPTPLAVSAAACHPSEPSCSTQAEDGSGTHQNVQPRQMNASVMSVDSGQEVTSSSVVYEPVSVDDEHLGTEERSDVGISKAGSIRRAESVRTAESDAEGRITGTTGRIGDCSASEESLHQQPSCSDEIQSSNMVPAVSCSCAPQSQRNSDVLASQGFVPSDLTSQGWLPCESFISASQHTNAACDGDGDIAQISERFVPTDMHTQDLVPDDSPFEKMDRAEKDKDGSGDEQVVTDALNPVSGHEQTFGEKSGRCTVRHSAGATGNKVCAVLEKRRTTESSLSQEHCENSLFEEHQPDTQNEEENVCWDSFGKSPEHHVYHSTQNTSSDGSRSPSVLDISSIPQSNPAVNRNSVSVSKPSRPEHLKETECQKTHTKTARGNKRVVPVSQKSRNEKRPTSQPPANVSKQSRVICQESPENTCASKVLVDCSGSSDSEDAFDRELMKKVTGHGSTRNTADVQPGSSGETVVVPDSSQEDVILVSSSEGNSVGKEHRKSSEREAHTVGELINHIEKPPDNRKRRDCLNFVNSASPRKITRSETNCPLLPAGKPDHETRTNQSFVARNKSSHNTRTHAVVQKTKSVNTQLRKTLNENTHEQEKSSSVASKDKDSGEKSKDDKNKNKQILDHGQNRVSMRDRDQRRLTKSTVAENPSDSDEASAEECDVQRVVSPSRKRLSPWDGNHLHFYKRPRQKECVQVCSDSSVRRSTIPTGSGVDSSETFRPNNRKITHPNTSSVHSSRQSSSEHAVSRQTKNTFSHRLHPFRTERSTTVKAQLSFQGTSSDSFGSTRTPVHGQTGRRTNVSASSSVSKISGRRQNVCTEEVDSSSDEDGETTSFGFSRSRVIRNTLTANIAQIKFNKKHSTCFESACFHASPHSNISANRSPYAARKITNNFKQTKGSEKDDSFFRKGQITTSSKQAPNQTKSLSPPTARGTVQLSRATTSRNTSPRAVFARLQHLDSSETEEETASETDCCRDNLADRMRTNFRAWLEHTKRSEDPKQKKLRQLKLIEELLKKVEECLGKQST